MVDLGFIDHTLQLMMKEVTRAVLAVDRGSVAAITAAVQRACRETCDARTSWAGINAKERGRACSLAGESMYWNIGGIDSVSHLERRVAKGTPFSDVGCVLSCVIGNRVVAAGVIDLFRPDDITYTFRWSTKTGKVVFGGMHPSSMYALPTTPAVPGLHQAMALVLGNPEESSPLLGRVIAGMSGVHTMEYGDGIAASRLWLGQYSLLVRPPGEFTPWDHLGPAAIDRALGVVHLRPSANGQTLELCRVPFITAPEARLWGMVSLHREHLPALAEVVQIRKS